MSRSATSTGGNKAIATIIANLSESDLEKAMAWGGKNWQGIYTIYPHNGHHTSEILLIGYMLGFWVEYRWA